MALTRPSTIVSNVNNLTYTLHTYRILRCLSFLAYDSRACSSIRQQTRADSGSPPSPTRLAPERSPSCLHPAVSNHYTARQTSSRITSRHREFTKPIRYQRIQCPFSPPVPSQTGWFSPFREGPGVSGNRLSRAQIDTAQHTLTHTRTNTCSLPFAIHPATLR
ncbi:hypothetical protein K456DRAFT_884863 [Colletotrichum gloeosporioides 23]|nr:hypothetical protein K456DRAFT_884863 [Colletotrichum gloeosporioides 23]